MEKRPMPSSEDVKGQSKQYKICLFACIWNSSVRQVSKRAFKLMLGEDMINNPSFQIVNSINGDQIS